MPNQGEKRLSLLGTDGPLASVFQIAQVTRPLMSVGKICDEGFHVSFDADSAFVLDKSGKTVLTFHRKHGGLYVAKLKLKQPFTRQGS